jgi:uncharacterized protein (TIGR02466 family)
MIGKRTAFRAEVFTNCDVGTDEQRAEIVQQLKFYQSQSNGMGFSNPGCFRIDKPDINISWLFDEINVLLVEAVKFYKQEDSVFSKLVIGQDAIVHWWANINAPGSRNTFHTHKEDEFSCVYYLQGTDTGDLRFPNPANLLGDCSKTSPFTRDFLFAPNDGDLILFPSWLPHEVEPNLSNRERINIAFNFKVTQ